MAYNLYITETANKQLDNIVNYMIHKLKNPSAASLFLDNLEQKLKVLCDNPQMYELIQDKRLLIKGYRKIPLDNYIIIYLVNDNTQEIEIRDIFYCRQDYSKYL